jgi:hypothetical protein
MSTGLDDIEKEESPEETIYRLTILEGVALSAQDRLDIFNGKYTRSTSNANNATQNNTGNGDVSTLANSDPTQVQSNPNTSGAPIITGSTPPPPPPPPVDSTGTYTIWLPVGENRHDSTGVKDRINFRTFKFDNFEVQHVYKFCKCEGDPEDVAFLRAEARTGNFPLKAFAGGLGQKVEGTQYFADFDKEPDAEGNYQKDQTYPKWHFNQNNQTKYIGDDQCPRGKKRLTADGVQLGKVGVNQEPPKEVSASTSTITYEKVEIQPIEYIGLDIIDDMATRFPKIKSLKFPPVIIDSITIPTGSNGTVVLDDIDIVREPYVVDAQTVQGNPPTQIYDDIQLKPITFLSDKIKVKNDVPITFRSITFPTVIIDSITKPDDMPESAEIGPIVVSETPIVLPAREYNQLPANPTQEEQPEEEEGVTGEIKNETIILKNVELKVPIRGKAQGLKFWKVMTNQPEIVLDDPANEQLKITVPNIMIPNNPKKSNILDKIQTDKLSINKSLIDYVPNTTNPSEVSKDKYIIYTMQGKTVPDVGDVYFDDDNGDTIYYGVNTPYRDKTPVPNNFEYCKCSGDDANTSEYRGYARLGQMLAGSSNKKYFKQDTRDRIAGVMGKYIGDDKCPDGETQLTKGTDPDVEVYELKPDQEEIIKFEDVIIDTQKIVKEDQSGQFSNLDPEILKNLPEIKVNLIEVPVILEGGKVKSGTNKIEVDFAKLSDKSVVSGENITVPKETPKEEEQKINVPKQSISKSEQIAGSSKQNKNKKGKSNAKTKGKAAKTKEETTTFNPNEEAVKILKGRSIPSAPGKPVPTTLKGKGTIKGANGFSRNYHTQLQTFADWQWTWPISADFKPGFDVYEQGGDQWVKGNSRPSNLGAKTPYWWPYLKNWKVSQPEYYWNGGTIPEFVAGVGRNIMWDEQFAPFSSKVYHSKNLTHTLKNDLTYTVIDQETRERVTVTKKAGDKISPPLNWDWIIWKNTRGGWEILKDAPGKIYPKDYRYPYMIAGRNLIRQYIPYAFSADWKKLVSKFRLSKKVDPSGGDAKSPYGGPLPADYTPSLLDVGLIMNFFQCGYVNRFKLPTGNFPPLAASGTEQHLMMLDDVQDKWVAGNKGYDPMIGTFNGGTSIVLNWAHEPHWCGISTDFFLRRGGFKSQGTTSVKSNESNIINGGIPLNRPRLEETIDEPWDIEKWIKLGGVGVGIRDKFIEAYNKHGSENFEHPITREYLNQYAEKKESNNMTEINSIWFIGGIHYDEAKGVMTQRGRDLLRIAINPEFIDWPAAVVSHTGHVESVACLDVDGELFRLGGNTSTGKTNYGNENNHMGLYRTHISAFGGYPGGGERGGFALISKPDGVSEKNRKHRVGGKGISSPWIITPVMQTYYDFLENNPDPEYPVFNNYQTAIYIMNTVFKSNLR